MFNLIRLLYLDTKSDGIDGWFDQHTLVLISRYG
jgi:hypothetical protein